MLRIIKYSLLIVFLILLCAGILKDKILDTPQRSKQKISSFLAKTGKNDIEANIFKTDKTYVYKIYYLALIPMGELKFISRVDDLGNTFGFQASTEKSFVEKFITAKAGVKSYYSKNIRLPYKYTEITDVKGKVKTKEIIFDQANLITTRGDRKFKIPLNTYDPVSAFVHMLSLPLKAQNIKFVSGEEVYCLKSSSLNEMAGIADVLVDMRREDLTSSHGATFHVWITNDNARVPLVFKCFSPVGYMSVVLDRAELD